MKQNCPWKGPTRPCGAGLGGPQLPALPSWALSLPSSKELLSSSPPLGAQLSLIAVAALGVQGYGRTGMQEPLVLTVSAGATQATGGPGWLFSRPKPSR